MVYRRTTLSTSRDVGTESGLDLVNAGLRTEKRRRL